MSIIFKSLRWKNFLSYGNYWTEIDFLKNPTTILTGPSGSGKSSFLCALTFALFGKPYRFINKPRLVNSINDKDCLVEIKFSIGQNEYFIRRGLKPVIFEIYCNGVLLNQDAKNLDYQKHLEQNILKLNFNSFTQIVVLGSASFIPFMQLTAAQRREIIEELLDLNVFTRMNKVLKEKQSLIREQSKQNESSIVFTKEKIQIQTEHLNKLQKKTKENKNTKIKEIEQIKESNKKSLSVINDLQLLLTEKKDLLKNQESLTSKLQNYKTLQSKATASLKQIEKTIDFYQKSDSCSVCKQKIDEVFKSEIIEKNQSKNLEYSKMLEEIDKSCVDIENSLKEYSTLQSEISDINYKISEENIRIKSGQDYITKIQKDLNVFDAEEIQQETDKLKDLEKTLNTYQEEKQTINDTKFNYDIMQSLLKDTGIKSKIIKQYLPLMNKYINKYLSAMDFFVNFQLDENFKETIKSRHRDEFEYNSFSEGEKFRIDIAMLLCWREIAKTKNITNTNLLILDEVFDSSLDESGTEDLMKLLKSLATNGTNIYIISHKNQLNDKFDANIKVEKKNNFSRMK